QLLGDSLKAFADLGPAVVALRLGAAGSLVYGRESAHMLRVPPAPANVVDVTGAGNAYCGGLLGGWVEHGGLDTAAAYAAISAALTIEQVGAPAITPALIATAAQRLPKMLAVMRKVKHCCD